MKKKLIVLAFSFVFFFSGIVPAFAQVNTCDNPNDPLGVGCGAQSGLSTVDPRITVARVISYVLQVLGMIALVLVLYAGFNWMTAAGDEEKIEKAKDTLKAAVIGLVIILSGYALTQFILFQIYGATTNSTMYGGGGGSNFACLNDNSDPSCGFGQPGPACSSFLQPDVCNNAQNPSHINCCKWKQR